MDVNRNFHMKQGLGETSYAQNSSFQKEMIESVMDITLSSAVAACAAAETPAAVSIADLGCSSGRNTLSVVENIIRAVCGRSCGAMRQLPEFMVFLNDLPSNDFNTLFSLVPELVKRLKAEHDGGLLVLVAGIPGSFYGRLFPSSSLQLMTSFNGLNWLSQVPPGLFNEGKPVNKGKVYMSPASPPLVATRYFEQFQKDFSLFLTSRSQEVVGGGRIVISMIGRKRHGSHKKNELSVFEALGKSFSILVTQKLVEEEQVDSFNLPLYTPSMQELEDQVYREGSFTINYMKQDSQSFTTENPDPKMFSKSCRAATESLICHHFGEKIIEPLFETHTQVIHEKLEAREYIDLCQIVLVLCKSASR
ncbi:salicylate carboxymethyltransferase-like [Iris pallida]|uniref:Salicylate carboxymethyltransferase-like n=1 Tax=Iris pallida TaxID=29817 RepID=A0AAX6E8L9_IRIPA|nr:salicylate carboxymethyltransferase-like [Iris pallida]